MRNFDHENLREVPLADLFRFEAENQTAFISSGLLQLEGHAGTPPQFEALMRAAHSLKGAAQIVNHQAAVRVAHALEDCFVAAQHGKIQLNKVEINLLLEGVDLLLQIARQPVEDASGEEHESAATARRFITAAAELVTATSNNPGSMAKIVATRSEMVVAARTNDIEDLSTGEPAERVLRLTAQNLNRLLGLAGESMVESRWLQPFADSLARLKRLQSDTLKSLDQLRDLSLTHRLPETISDHIGEAIRKTTESSQFLADRVAELKTHDRRSTNLSHRLYHKILQCRMLPFGEGTRHFPRMVRDLAQVLGKQVRLEIVGEQIPVDREILEKLEAPLGHLLRNAVDHGCESPEDRIRAGKSVECTVRVEARHSAGMLLVSVADDGVGIQPEELRRHIINKRLALPAVVEKLSEPELLEFLLLPGFTMRETVTEISGRGVGLDVVQNMVRSVRGNLRMAVQPGRGMRLQMYLPLTLSVVRALLVEVASEPYAIPLAQVNRTLKLPREDVATLQGRPHFALEGRNLGLLTAHQLLGYAQPFLPDKFFSVVVLGDQSTRYGMVVDRFLGERELVVQALDPRLGKVSNISSGAFAEDGSPVLILDVEECVHSIERLASGENLTATGNRPIERIPSRIKRILVVDDSLTVRELERNILTQHGYTAEVAVDAMDGWNAARSGNYDLIITDVDMPRMDGIELATLIKNDPRLKTIPVMIISYKDRENDRRRGVEAGADYYLTKASFHRDTLLRIVADLIGKPEA